MISRWSSLLHQSKPCKVANFVPPKLLYIDQMYWWGLTRLSLMFFYFFFSIVNLVCLVLVITCVNGRILQCQLLTSLLPVLFNVGSKQYGNRLPLYQTFSVQIENDMSNRNIPLYGQNLIHQAGTVFPY
jgi:hypothetical protein